MKKSVLIHRIKDEAKKNMNYLAWLDLKWLFMSALSHKLFKAQTDKEYGDIVNRIIQVNKDIDMASKIHYNY